MRIVGGIWRGRALRAPPGGTTRPTADRVRQALFDMLLHAPWGGREVIEGAHVLDVFAGTGALGLEALSRGAAFASFIEQDRTALAALRANIAMLGAEGRSAVLAADAVAVVGRAVPGGAPCSLVLLDPPYGGDLLPRALAHLTALGWIAPGALIVAETARAEPPLHADPSAAPWATGSAAPLVAPLATPLAERTHGAARITVWRAPATGV